MAEEKESRYLGIHPDAYAILRDDELSHAEKRDLLWRRKAHLRIVFSGCETIHHKDSFSRCDGRPYINDASINEDLC